MSVNLFYVFLYYDVTRLKVPKEWETARIVVEVRNMTLVSDLDLNQLDFLDSGLNLRTALVINLI